MLCINFCRTDYVCSASIQIRHCRGPVFNLSARHKLPMTGMEILFGENLLLHYSSENLKQ